MQRALQLAALGEGHTMPNPMVGCVIVADNRIIGEGFHHRYGEPHAEVVAIDSVLPEDRHLLSSATLYVTLEPCSHHGKTPPCANRIVAEGIPHVVAATQDPNALVGGNGFALLRNHGVTVTTGILEAASQQLNAHFFHYHTHDTPFVTLKWAQSRDGFIGKTGERTPLSHPVTNRLVHRWRAAHHAIMIGYTTAVVDQPQLTNRLWPGRSPIRVVWDSRAQLPPAHPLLDGSHPTLLLVQKRPSAPAAGVTYLEVAGLTLREVLQQLHQQGVQSILVEGGANTLQQFIDRQLWQQAHVIHTPAVLGSGVAAPTISGYHSHSMRVATDTIQTYLPL